MITRVSGLEEVRAQRAREGSRRRRDVEALEAAAARVVEDRESRLLACLRATPAAARAWDEARDALARCVPESTFRLWLDPLGCLGESQGALYVVAGDHVYGWASRRYSTLIGDAVRRVSDYRGVFLMPRRVG